MKTPGNSYKIFCSFQGFGPGDDEITEGGGGVRVSEIPGTPAIVECPSQGPRKIVKCMSLPARSFPPSLKMFGDPINSISS